MLIGAATLGYQLVRPEPVESRHVPITTKIVFNREIAQIFQKKCFQCHTDGNVGMALTTYAEARPWAVAIKEEILERKMPPWSAAGGYGHFANDMSLTAREIELDPVMDRRRRPEWRAPRGRGQAAGVRAVTHVVGTR